LEIGYAFQIGGYINYRTLMELLLFMYVLFKVKDIPPSLLKQSYVLYAFLIIPVLLLLIFPSNQLVAVVDTSWDEILVGGAKRKNPEVNGFVFQMLIQFFIYILIYLYIISNYRKKDYLRLLGKANLLVNIMLILGLLEFIAVSVLHQGPLWGELKVKFFGFSESTITEGRVRGNLNELCLFTKEASHYATLLFLTFFIKMAYNKSRNRYVSKFLKSIFIGKANNTSYEPDFVRMMQRNYFILLWTYITQIGCDNSKTRSVFDFYLCLNIFLLAVSMSFTALLCIFGLLGVLLMYRWLILKPSSIKLEKVIVFSVVCISLLVFSTIINTLNEEGFLSRRVLSLIEEMDVITSDRWMSESTALEWSNRVRLLSVFQTMMAFFHRPLFGYGVGAVTAHGATPMFLAGAGLVGVYLWSQFNFFQNRMLRIFHSEKTGIILSVLFFLTVFMFGGFLRNFYEVSVILVALSFCVIFSKHKYL